ERLARALHDRIAKSDAGNPVSGPQLYGNLILIPLGETVRIVGSHDRLTGPSRLERSVTLRALVIPFGTFQLLLGPWPRVHVPIPTAPVSAFAVDGLRSSHHDELHATPLRHDQRVHDVRPDEARAARDQGSLQASTLLSSESPQRPSQKGSEHPRAGSSARCTRGRA